MIALVGPTATGKSQTALALAELLQEKTGRSAQIVAVDSMQVYRGMEIATGKPSASARRAVAHHGLDLAEPEEEFDVVRYVRAVTPVLQAARAGGRPALLVGGCGFYLRGLLEGIHPAPGKDPEVREALLREGALLGAGRLHARLREVDPAAAQRIHPNDLRRTVRALEVFRVTGRPLTDWESETVSPFSNEPVFLAGLTCERSLLAERIARRTRLWLQRGWLEEARGLLRRRLSRTAREALGYAELFSHLEGRISSRQVEPAILLNTRRYAKRQRSWFRRDGRITWWNIEGKTPALLAREILTAWQRNPAWNRHCSSTSL